MTGLLLWRWVLDLGWLLVLCLLFVHFWRDRKSLLKAQSWLKTKGHITKCEWTQAGHRIWPEIAYSYEVQDQQLTGAYLFLDTTHNTPSSKYARQVAYKAAVAFKENKEIDIYYNPNDPTQSALDVALPKKLNFILFLIGMLLCLHIGLIIWRSLP